MTRLGLLLVAALAACGPAVETTAPVVPPAVREAPPALVDYAAPLEVGEVPESVRETGDCTLHLRLRDADDGSPVAMYARLWRLGVGADSTWTAGDQIQARLTVGADGATIEHLPPGRYRAEVPDQRAASDDPPEFTVDAGSIERILDVRPRRTHHLRLRVYDADGATVRHVTGEIAPDDWTAPGPMDPPAWADPRWPLDAPSRTDPMRPGKPSRCFFTRRLLPPLEGGPDGFDLGTLRDAGRTDSPSVSAEIQVAGRNDVGASAAGGQLAGAEALLMAVCVPYEKLVDHVERPDGTTVPAGFVRVTFAVCHAIPCVTNPPADAWRDVKVFVKVAVVGFEDLTYDWTAATADERHVLRERRSK